MIVHSGADPETKLVCDEDWAARGLTVRYFAYAHKSAALQRDFAVRRTPHPLIMFADDDMEFEPDWIESLLRVLMTEPGIGATMGCIDNQTISVPTGVWRAYRRLVASPERALGRRRGDRRAGSQRISTGRASSLLPPSGLAAASRCCARKRICRSTDSPRTSGAARPVRTSISAIASAASGKCCTCRRRTACTINRRQDASTSAGINISRCARATRSARASAGMGSAARADAHFLVGDCSRPPVS